MLEVIPSFALYIVFCNYPLFVSLQIQPPFKPQVESDTDTRYFDDVFTGEAVQLTPPDANAMDCDDDDMPNFEQFSFHGSIQSLSNLAISTPSLNSIHSLGIIWGLRTT